MAVIVLLIWIAFFEIGLLYWLLCGTVLEKKYFRKKEWSILCGNIVGLGGLLGINRSMCFFSSFMFVICVIATCICVVLINGQNKSLKIILVILYCTSVALVDFFFAFVSMMFLKKEFDAKVYWYANSLTECIIFLCTRMVMAGCIGLILKRKYKESYLCEFQGILLIAAIIMCLILGAYQVAIVRMIYENREGEAGAVGISLAGVLLTILLIGMLYVKNKMLEKEKEFLTMRDEMVTQKFVELESVMEKNRQLSYDLKNHLIVLKNYEKEGNYEGIRNYLKEIEQEYFEIKVRTWTGNPLADMLIEQKRALAEREGVTSFTIQAVPISEWPFHDSETCSLLGNLLDNAIDACKRMDNEKDRWISIIIESQKKFLFIKIRNSIDETPIMKGGRPICVKSDKRKHGYGLKSVERIVDKYEGIISYQIKDNIFQANLSF